MCTKYIKSVILYYMRIGQKVYLKPYNKINDHWAIPQFEWEMIEINNPNTIIEIITTNNGIAFALEKTLYHFPENVFRNLYKLPDELFEI